MGLVSWHPRIARPEGTRKHAREAVRIGESRFDRAQKFPRSFPRESRRSVYRCVLPFCPLGGRSLFPPLTLDPVLALALAPSSSHYPPFRSFPCGSRHEGTCCTVGNAREGKLWQRRLARSHTLRSVRNVTCSDSCSSMHTPCSAELFLILPRPYKLGCPPSTSSTERSRTRTYPRRATHGVHGTPNRAPKRAHSHARLLDESRATRCYPNVRLLSPPFFSISTLAVLKRSLCIPESNDPRIHRC